MYFFIGEGISVKYLKRFRKKKKCHFWFWPNNQDDFTRISSKGMTARKSRAGWLFPKCLEFIKTVGH